MGRLARYNLDVAPAPKTEIEKSRLAEIVANGFAQGLNGPQIANKLAKGDKKKAKALRKRIRAIIYHENADLRAAVARQAQGDMLAGLPAAVTAMTRRAGRGNVPAAKLVFESSGFHNPRVKHEHSGEVKIVMDMPRPTFHAEATADEIPAEAEAVD